ncbi:unnamed protein product [Rotaria sordida]|uniref:Uncharacterized protein n=2 Tax=Rotaria sordida TaxID=392033 RepID=A0A813VD36_9BILA|nr:unnamed protein product [Rotaria sordida]CAF0834944.1 unnamed protein product [Rotaria sordida]CAF3671906.1 unnamed protein product [Rotaria sordida]
MSFSQLSCSDSIICTAILCLESIVLKYSFFNITKCIPSSLNLDSNLYLIPQYNNYSNIEEKYFTNGFICSYCTRKNFLQYNSNRFDKCSKYITKIELRNFCQYSFLYRTKENICQCLLTNQTIQPINKWIKTFVKLGKSHMNPIRVNNINKSSGNFLHMASATARYPLKPKTLTLLELCQSFHDFRHPPVSLSSYQSQSSSSSSSSSNSSHVLTRRIYLHPLTLNPHSKQHSLKHSSVHSLTTFDHEQRSHQLNSDKNREIHHIKNKSSFHGLAVLSSSAPITTRINTKSDTRHIRDKQFLNIDEDINSDYDVSTLTISSSQPSLQSLTRGTSSSTHTICTRPSCVMNNRKTYFKSNHWDKVDVWNHLDRTLERPMPTDPPTTPFNTVVDLNKENDELQEQYSNYNSIQEIKIYKRNPIQKTNIDQNDDNDNYDDYSMYYEN